MILKNEKFLVSISFDDSFFYQRTGMTQDTKVGSVVSGIADGILQVVKMVREM